ncbi:uncharacterized protein LOC116110588 [Pistacia vera]|uniref:Uncharacterized protein n=1 Tax=Pistacia integerrima TaxID=434235 RepID=A0ACC0YBC0_9ROSI|nr:uncharacterized protein LOC116110588 [Pistacia vera]KAJ0031677.1 hypothetical protein Pint_13012 [Pistacia integerrima]
MSSILSSQGVVLATAMAAVSGTVILLAFRLQKSSPTTQFSIDRIPHDSPQVQVLRSCISSEGKKREKKKKKRVHFAEDVVDPRGNGKEFRKQHSVIRKVSLSSSSSSSPSEFKRSGGMPANRVALYNGILRDRRCVQRLGCSY